MWAHLLFSFFPELAAGDNDGNKFPLCERSIAYRLVVVIACEGFIPMFKRLLLVTMALAALVVQSGVAYSQYNVYPSDLRITLAPKAAGQSQGFVENVEKVYPMNPGQAYLPIAGNIRPGTLRTVRVELERTGIMVDVPVAPNGLFLLNFPLEGFPPGVYRLLINGFHVSTIRIV